MLLSKMTELFKCLLLSSAVSVVFGFTNVRDDVNWFKNGQRIKNRFVTGVVNGIVDFDCSDTVNGENIEGECLSKVECTKAGGKVGGLCSLLGSCCVLEKSCSQTTSSKLSYFVPPKNFQSDCPLTVNIYSKDVCQIRLDFEKFDIAKPTNQERTSEDTNEKIYTSYQCHRDSFTVENVKKNLGFPHLCGKNKGQHIYIPVAENQQNVVLRFTLKDRNNTNEHLDPYDWRIKIRQLECRKSYEHLLNAPSKLMSMYNMLKNKKKPNSDWELIAPPNCLQYYPKKTGTFESFNYDGGVGCYIGHLNYAICFRKTPEICGAKYTGLDKFQMNSNRGSGTEPDDKCHPKKPSSSVVSQDYLRIPGGVTVENVYRDNYCDGDLQSQTVIAKSYEPLYVGVHTDEFRANKEKDNVDDDYQEIGFRIQYELYSGDCDVPF